MDQKKEQTAFAEGAESAADEEKTENPPLESHSEAPAAEQAGSAKEQERATAERASVQPDKPQADRPEGEGGAENSPENLPEKAEGNAPEMQEAQPPKKKHRWIWNIVLIAVIALGLYSLFGISGEITEGDGYTFTDAISNISGAGTAMFIAVVCGVMIVDCLKFCVANKAVIGKVRPLVAIKTSFLGKFYDGITPFSTGGQPMQIYYMTTKGVSGADSSAIVLIRYFGTIFAFTFLGALSMILGVVFGVLDNVSGSTLLMVAGWIGLAVNLILPIFITFFICLPGLARRCTTWFINVGAKLHIVKHKERVMAKALKTVEDFVSSFKIIVKKPLYLVLFLLCCFAENTLTFSIPFFAMKALSCNVDGLYFTVFSLNAFATFGVSFIPTPGNSGVVEGMGALAFQVAAGPALAWCVLIWRFGVFYVYILIGVIMIIFDLIVKNINNNAEKRGRKKAEAKKE